MYMSIIPFVADSTNNGISRITFLTLIKGLNIRLFIRSEFGKTLFTKVVGLVETSP